MIVKVNGKDRADISKGKSVTFIATVEVPPNAGSIVSAEWDFEGEGTFRVVEKFKSAKQINLKTTHTFSKSGTYFPTLRVASQREGDSKTPFARVQNLGRVRVVVK